MFLISFVFCPTFTGKGKKRKLFWFFLRKEKDSLNNLDQKIDRFLDTADFPARKDKKVPLNNAG